MSGWCHKSIPNYSARAAVLTDMTSPKRPSQLFWTEETETAFKDIQQALSRDPVLYCLDFQQPLILQTDASDDGLLQGPEDGCHLVAFVSRKLYLREVHYSTVEKECVAVKWALDSLKYYLFGREFTLEVDHRALKCNSRITPWYLAMQPYNASHPW